MDTIWKRKEQPPKEFTKKFPYENEAILSVLWNRGIRDKRDATAFFSPKFPQDLGDPMRMKGMKKFIARLKKAAEKNERVLVYGDYDMDGVGGTIILKTLLERLGVRSVDVYLPYREKEGYGLNEHAVRSFVLKNISLLITVDCGITNVKEVALANRLGFDVLILDHHKPPAVLPKAYAIVDVHQKGDSYPFKDFCATGLAFKVVQAARADRSLAKRGNLSWEWAQELLDLVALATISDMMPLRGENRVLVRQGLRELNRTKRPGLRALMKHTRASYGFSRTKKGDFTAREVAFMLVPPLNAAGRMDHASGAYNILVTKDGKESEELARLLCAQNAAKQKVIQRIMRTVERRLNAFNREKEWIIFEGDETWPHSLAGVVAGRLAEKYWMPVHVYHKGRETSIGHCRTIPGYDLVKAMTHCRKFFIKFGGHPVAAGWTSSNKNLRKVRRCLGEYAKKVFPKGLPPKPLWIDAELSLSQVNESLARKIAEFEPFGVGNENPRFLIANLRVLDFNGIGKGGRHLCVVFEQEGVKRKAFWFNNGRKIRDMTIGSRVDIVCTLTKEKYERGVMLMIEDLKIA